MDEEIAIINNNTRSEKIRNFFTSNKKKIITYISLVILIIFGYFFYNDIKKKNKVEIANKYNVATINFTLGKKEKVKEELVKLIKKKNETYSPLALYFLIDNNIVSEKEEINKLFNIIINETKLEKEIKNLIIYKKALFNSNFVTENELIMILKPLINSESIWSSHALYLIAEFFHSKDETSKAKEFYSKIIIIKNGNPNIVEMAQRRLNRELSE